MRALDALLLLSAVGLRAGGRRRETRETRQRVTKS